MVGDVDDRKSTNRMIYFLSGGAICWQSTKQKVVALSSCEAEYIATSTAATQGLAYATDGRTHRKRRRSINAIRGQQSYDLPEKNPVLHNQSKHIEIRFHYIRECADRGLIKIGFIRTEEQLGNIFTRG